MYIYTVIACYTHILQCDIGRAPSLQVLPVESAAVWTSHLQSPVHWPKAKHSMFIQWSHVHIRKIKEETTGCFSENEDNPPLLKMPLAARGNSPISSLTVRPDASSWRLGASSGAFAQSPVAQCRLPGISRWMYCLPGMKLDHKRWVKA